MPETGKRQAKRLLEKEEAARMAQQNYQYIVCNADGARGLLLIPELFEREFDYVFQNKICLQII